MTTAEFIVCEVLGDCGYADIEPMFGGMDEDLFCEAVQNVKDNIGELSANAIWYEAMDIAICRVFGVEYIDNFEIDANCKASSVGLLVDVDEIEGFRDKVEEFNELTGVYITY